MASHNFTITQESVNRSFIITQDGDSRLFTINTGVGPAGESVTVDQTIIDGSTNAVSGNAVFDGLALKAPIDNPTFTGIVTAPRITGRCDGLEVLCKAGVSVNAGQVVYVTGASGNNIIIGLAQANAELTSSKTIGVSESTLTTNATGYVITEGLLTVSISAPTANEGDPIWLSPTTAGGMVFGAANRPVAPNHMVYLGVVTRKTGNTIVEIFVKVQNGSELEELADVLIASPTAGQALMRGASLWENRSLVAADISNSTTAGRALLTAADAAAQRTAMELGTAAITASTDYATAAQGTLATGAAKQSGKPSRIYNTQSQLATNRQATKPVILSTLIIGDSWALGVDDFIKGQIGQAGYITGPIGAALTNATLTAGKSEYGKTPWGQSVVIDASGEFSIWGVSSGGVASAGRFQASRYITVHYEAISGGGTIQVQYEDRTGAWQTVGNINTNNSGASTYTVYESSVLAAVETPRVRLNWVSGSSKIYAVGAVANPANSPAIGTSRSGGVFCDVSYGGSTAEEWDETPQEAWTALLSYLKTNIVFVRESREISLATWETEINSLVSKLRTARSTIDIVFIGSHPMSSGFGTNADETDAFLRTYCATNDHLFVDMRSFFPATYDASLAIGFQNVDGVHLTLAGNAFARSIIWRHLPEITGFIGEANSTVQNAPWFTANGVQKQFLIQQDGNVENATFGTSWLHRGTTSPNPGIQIVFNRRDTTFLSEGLSWTYQGQPYWQMDSSNRHFVSSTNTALSRTLGGTMEFNSGQAARIALRASGITGQTANISEVRTGASPTVTGTLVAGHSPIGTPFATLTSYANDAAADADAALVSGAFYQITGSRIIYRKP